RVLALSPAFPHLTPPPPAPALSPLSLHDALPISSLPGWVGRFKELETGADSLVEVTRKLATDVEDEARSEILAWASAVRDSVRRDRKSTRLNSSHEWISYAVFCLKKKENQVTCG